MTAEPHVMTIPGCEQDCPLKKFKSLLSDVIPKDWNYECKRPDPLLDQYYIVALAGACMALSVTLVGFLVNTQFWNVRKKYLTIVDVERAPLLGSRPIYRSI